MKRGRPRGEWRVAALLAAATAIVYLPHLQNSPIYLSKDEVFSSLTAQSIASTGRDLAGRFLPLYSQGLGVDFWFPPVLTYSIALILEVAPFSETTVRLPMTMAGILDVVLVFWIARLLLERTWPAVAASALMALTPAHFLIVRHAQDPGAPLPFVLGWLLCLLLFLRDDDGRFLFAAGALLGAAEFSYVGATVLMPLYLLVTYLVLFRRRASRSRYLALTVGFLVPVLLAAPWIVRHADAFRESFLHYQSDSIRAAGQTGMSGGVLGYYKIHDVLSLYRNFWDTRFLFVDGSPILAFSTNREGVFLVALAGLVAAGVVRLLRRRLPTPLLILLLGALLLAPIPASLVDVHEVAAGRAIWRAAEVIPIVVLLAALGFDLLWRSDTQREGQIAFLLVCGIPLVLVPAYRDYFPNPEALHRCATIPLLVAAAPIFRKTHRDHDPPAVPTKESTAIAIGTLLTLHVGYLLSRSSPGARAVLDTLTPVASVACLATLTMAPPRASVRAGAALLGLLACQFTYMSIDYAHEHLAKGAFAIGALLVMLGATNVARSKTVDSAQRPRDEALILTIVAYGTLALFLLDSIGSPGWRYLGGLVVFAVLVWGSTRIRNLFTNRQRLAQLAAVGVFTLAIAQFASFYVDYFTDCRRAVLS